MSDKHLVEFLTNMRFKNKNYGTEYKPYKRLKRNFYKIFLKNARKILCQKARKQACRKPTEKIKKLEIEHSQLLINNMSILTYQEKIMNHKTYAETLCDIEQLKQEAEKIRTSELDATIEVVKKSISIYGIMPSDVFSNEALGYIQPNVVADDTPTSHTLNSGAINPPKYTNGKSMTWTGNGRKPQWFLDAVTSGVAPEMMLISENPEKKTMSSTDNGKVTHRIHRIKGPGEKKYTDGMKATWTGNGRKPKWFLDSVASGVTPEMMLISRNLSHAVENKLSAKEVLKNGTAKNSKEPGVPKYTDGMKATWTGNGRQPKWFKKAMASGVNPKEMLIKKINDEKPNEVEKISETDHQDHQEVKKDQAQKNYMSAVPIMFTNGKWRIFNGGGLKLRRLTLTKALQDRKNGFVTAPSSPSKNSQMEELKEFIEKLSNHNLDSETSIDKENKLPRKKGPGYRLGDHSWTGVGPRPKWLKEAIESGKILEELRET